MAKLWEKLGNAKDNSDLAEVDMTALRLSSPTVIYFAGKDQADNNPTELSKGIYFLDKLFAELEKPPKVYIYSHSSKYAGQIGNLSSLFRTAAYNYIPAYSTSAGKKLAKELVMPLVTTAGGQPLPEEMARQNLRQLTFVGYCLGSVATQEVHNASMKMMQKAGYSKAQAQSLLREITLVSFATFTQPAKEDDRYTTVAFINTDDFFINTKNLLVRPVSSLLKKGVRLVTLADNRDLQIKAISDSSIVISAAARQSAVDTTIDKVFAKEDETQPEDEVRLPRWKFGASNHEATAYVNTEDETSQFARMVKYALLNAVSRKSLVRPIDLLDEPQAVKTPGYDQKITKGLFRAGGKKWPWRKNL